MTNDEAKTALLKRTPVVCNGIEYLCISAIIYRYDKHDNLIISAELKDKNKNSLTYAQIKDVITTYDKQNQTTPYVY